MFKIKLYVLFSKYEPCVCKEYWIILGLGYHGGYLVIASWVDLEINGLQLAFFSLLELKCSTKSIFYNTVLFPQRSNAVALWISKACTSVGSYSQTTTHGNLIDCDMMDYKHSISYLQGDQHYTQGKCHDQNIPKTLSFGSISRNQFCYQLCFSQNFINRKRTIIWWGNF